MAGLGIGFSTVTPSVFTRVNRSSDTAATNSKSENRHADASCEPV
jgi:hypothetical protein